MTGQKRISRRAMLMGVGSTTMTLAALGPLAACAPAARPSPSAAPAAPTPAPTSAPEATKPAVPAPTATPVVAQKPAATAKGKVNFGVGGWAVDSSNSILKKLDFTGQTGIQVTVVNQGAQDITTQMAAAVQAGTTPYDVLDSSDEWAITMSRAGWLLPLDSLFDKTFWTDWPKYMLDMADVWDKYNGATFRVHHNYEACYFWYRKDWFDAKGLKPPKTWDEVKGLGKVFTDEAKGVWASEDGLLKGGALNVFLAWTAKAAGGSQFEIDDKYQTALQYIDDLMNKSKVLSPADLQKNYDQQNADYQADRIAFMRQWPFFYDISRGNKTWYQEGKAEITFPPVGPAGPSYSTYAAGWGFIIPKTTKVPDEAKTLLTFLVDAKNAPEMALDSVWWVCPRQSVLSKVGDQGIAKYLKMYSDAGIIATRPFHPKYVEALTIVEDAASSFLTHQITLEECMKQSKDRLAGL